MTNESRPIDHLRALITHSAECDSSPNRPDDLHDEMHYAIRDLLCDIDDDLADYDLSPRDAAILRDAMRNLMIDPYSRDDISFLALELSLCPLHFIDYAICFDDSDPECAPIRAIFPSHDT